jgi:hypothetical protein
MLHYLHIQAEPVMHHFYSKMLAGGDFNLIPGSLVPMQQPATITFSHLILSHPNRCGRIVVQDDGKEHP